MSQRRWAALAWAAPCSALGAAVGALLVLRGGGVQCHSGVLEFALPQPLGLRARRVPFRAITFGHVVIAASAADLHRLREHEHAHVRQYERWGVAFFAAYAASSLWQWLRGRNPYFDNAFEVEARACAAWSNSPHEDARPL